MDEKEVEKEVVNEGELVIPTAFFSEIQVANGGEPSESEDRKAGQAEPDLPEGMVVVNYEINSEFLHIPLHTLPPLTCVVVARRAQTSNKI